MNKDYVTTPVCSLRRATYLTGQYAHTHGILKNTRYSTEVTHGLLTYPRLLQQACYKTAFIGKWLLDIDANPRPGFDQWVGSSGKEVSK